MVAPQAYNKDSQLACYIYLRFQERDNILSKKKSQHYLFASEKTTNANSPPWERSNPILTLSERLSPTRGPNAVIINVLITIKPAKSENTFGHSRIRSCTKHIEKYKGVRKAPKYSCLRKDKKHGKSMSMQEVTTKLNGAWNVLSLLSCKLLFIASKAVMHIKKTWMIEQKRQILTHKMQKYKQYLHVNGSTSCHKKQSEK